MVIFCSNDTFWILLFLYYSFGVQKTNTCIRSRGSLENHTRFKTIMVKIYTRFQTKNQNGSKTIPFGAAHTYIACIRECPPPPPPPGNSSLQSSHLLEASTFLLVLFCAVLLCYCPRHVHPAALPYMKITMSGLDGPSSLIRPASHFSKHISKFFSCIQLSV